MAKRFVLILLVAGMMLGCCLIVTAGEGPELSITETITLKNSSSLYIMMLLGLCSEKESLAGRDISCTYSQTLKAVQRQIQGQDIVSTCKPLILPDGVNSISSISSDRSLRVVGTVEGVKSFRRIISLLDVPRKQVQIKTEVYKVMPGSADVLVRDLQTESKKTDQNPLNVAYMSAARVDELKTRLVNEGAELQNSPIISTLNNETAHIEISSLIPVFLGGAQNDKPQQFIKVACEVSARPRVNGDGSITVNFDAVFPRDDKSDVENAQRAANSLHTDFRVKSGESAVIYQTASESGNWLLLIVTPTVVPDAQSEKPAASVIQ